MFKEEDKSFQEIISKIFTMIAERQSYFHGLNLFSQQIKTYLYIKKIRKEIMNDNIDGLMKISIEHWTRFIYQLTKERINPKANL